MSYKLIDGILLGAGATIGYYLTLFLMHRLGW